MGLNSFTRSKGYRNFMAKLYGWGASVVILGALFKINHYTGANLMLIIGLGTEATIFFFSAFEPPHVEPDWSLVYPELAGMYHGVEVEVGERKGLTSELDKMLEEAKISQSTIDSLGQGLRNLSEKTSKLNDVSDAVLATNEYVKNVKGAAKSAEVLTQTYQKTSDSLNVDVQVTEEYANSIKNASASAASLSNAYSDISKTIKSEMSATEELAGNIKEASKSANYLSEKYSKSADMLTKSLEALDFSGVSNSNINSQIQKISDKLAALNSVYELQLKSTNQQVDASAKLQSTLDQFITNLNDSVQNTVVYKKEVDALTKNVAALNHIYGNMLAAMNVKVGQ